MTIKQELEQELDETYQRFLSLLELVPESDYSLPSSNPAWTVGDILFHITLGPRALALEVWLTLYARGLYQLAMRFFPSRMFNRLNRKEAYVMPLAKEVKTKAIEDFHRHEKDTGSPEVQIAILTNRITQLTEHLRNNKQDQSCRRGLLKLVGQRRRLLAYLRKSNYQSYINVTDRLQLRRK
jgi:small subunit ribosomal protein S15